MIAEITAVMAPVFFCAALGYIWARSGWAWDNDMATRLIAAIGTPCLVLTILPRVDPSESTFRELSLATMAAIATWGVIGVIALKVFKLRYSTYLPSIMFPNTGNMGASLSLFAFGKEGLALAIVYMSTTMFFHFSLGITIAAGSFSVKRLARTPILHSVAISLVMIAFGWHLPKWAHNTVELIGGLTFPMMLIALGVSLSALRPANLMRSLWISVPRLALGFGVGLALATVLGFEGSARGVLILECSMPPAVFNYLLAEQYGTGPEEVASLVLVSTVFSFLTLPLLLGYVM